MRLASGRCRPAVRLIQAMAELKIELRHALGELHPEFCHEGSQGRSTMDPMPVI